MPVVCREILQESVGLSLRSRRSVNQGNAAITRILLKGVVGTDFAGYGFSSMDGLNYGDTTMTSRSIEADVSPSREHSGPPFNRRRETRIEDRHWYTYEMYDSHNSHNREGEPLVEGKVQSLNRSAQGILLVMSEAPHVRHIIVLSNPRLGWYRSTMVYEICWVQALPIEPDGHQFLVGCRHVTATSR